MFKLRPLLHVVPACVALLFTAVPGATRAQFSPDISQFSFAHLGQPLKLAPRPTTPDLTAVDEFGIDNSTAQHAKAFVCACQPALVFNWAEPSGNSCYRAPLSPYRCCAAPPTGPPHV